MLEVNGWKAKQGWKYSKYTVYDSQNLKTFTCTIIFKTPFKNTILKEY